MVLKVSSRVSVFFSGFLSLSLVCLLPLAYFCFVSLGTVLATLSHIWLNTFLFSWQELVLVQRQLNTLHRRCCRRRSAADLGGEGFTKRMRLVATSILIQSESRDCADDYLVRFLRPKLPGQQRLVEDWLLQTADELMLSASVTPTCDHDWRIRHDATVWIAEWRTARWLEKETASGCPKSGFELIHKYQEYLPEDLRQHAVFDSLRLLSHGSVRLNDRFRQWCLRFKRRQKIRRGEFRDMDHGSHDFRGTSGASPSSGRL